MYLTGAEMAAAAPDPWCSAWPLQYMEVYAFLKRTYLKTATHCLILLVIKFF